MDTTFEIVLPVFGLIACGYALARTPLLTPEGVRGLTNFVFYVAIPALLFRTVGRGVPADALNPGIVVAYFGSTLALYGGSMLLGRLAFALPFAESALLGMGATFANSVMLGIPLIYAAFGEAGVVPMTLIVTFHSVIMLGLTTVLIEIGRGRGDLRRLPLVTLAALARNPIIVAIAVGLLWAATGLTLPLAADRFITLLSGAAAPCALASLGASLTEFRIAGNLNESLTMVALKLIAHPLLVYLVAAYVLGLDPQLTALLTIVAALPVGANVFVMAQRYEVYLQRSASGVLISTALAVASVAALMAWLVPAG